jgi:hypothetical protein
MNKYVVKMVHVFSTIVEVDADSKELALDEAEKKFTSQNDQGAQIYYEATMDKSNWAALTLEEYNNLKEKIKQDLEKNSSEEKSNIIEPSIITP